MPGSKPGGGDRAEGLQEWHEEWCGPGQVSVLSASNCFIVKELPAPANRTGNEMQAWLE